MHLSADDSRVHEHANSVADGCIERRIRTEWCSLDEGANAFFCSANVVETHRKFGHSPNLPAQKRHACRSNVESWSVFLIGLAGYDDPAALCYRDTPLALKA